MKTNPYVMDSGIVGTTDYFRMKTDDQLFFTDHDVCIAKSPVRSHRVHVGQTCNFTWPNGETLKGQILMKRSDGTWRVKWKDGTISSYLNPLQCYPSFSKASIFSGFHVKVGDQSIPLSSDVNLPVRVRRANEVESPCSNFPLFMFV